MYCSYERCYSKFNHQMFLNRPLPIILITPVSSSLREQKSRALTTDNKRSEIHNPKLRQQNQVHFRLSNIYCFPSGKWVYTTNKYGSIISPKIYQLVSCWKARFPSFFSILISRSDSPKKNPRKTALTQENK